MMKKNLCVNEEWQAGSLHGALLDYSTFWSQLWVVAFILFYNRYLPSFDDSGCGCPVVLVFNWCWNMASCSTNQSLIA